MNHDVMEDRLVALYEDGGQQAIYAYVEHNHPDWAWAFCQPCEDQTPTWDDCCAVCFTARSEVVA